MTGKRFTIKSQDDLFGVVDNYSPDKICVVNGIRTEIETKWLCNVLNNLNDENEQLNHRIKKLQNDLNNYSEIFNELNGLIDENEQLKQQLSDINGQLVMLDNCDNWDYDRMKHTVREIAEIIGYNGTINPKM